MELLERSFWMIPTCQRSSRVERGCCRPLLDLKSRTCARLKQWTKVLQSFEKSMSTMLCLQWFFSGFLSIRPVCTVFVSWCTCDISSLSCKECEIFHYSWFSVFFYANIGVMHRTDTAPPLESFLPYMIPASFICAKTTSTTSVISICGLSKFIRKKWQAYHFTH